MKGRSHSELAGLLVLGRVLATLSESLVMLVIVRQLGKPEVGVLSALLLVYQTLALVASAGFPAALMYFLPTRTAGERRAITTRFTWTLALLGGVCGGVMALLGAIDWYAPGSLAFVSGDASVSLRYLMVLAVFPIVDLPARLLPNLLVVEGRASDAAAVGILQSIGMTLATVLPIALGGDHWSVMAAIDAWGLVFGLVLLRYLRVLWRGEARVASPVSVREIIRFGVPLGLTDIIAFLNNRLDRWLVMVLFSAAVFAEYQAGAWQIPFIVQIPAAVGSVYTPHFRQLFAASRAQEAIDVWRASIVKVSLLVVPLTMVFVVAAEETMELLFTAEYARAAWVFRFYGVFTLLRVASFGNVIVAAGRSDLVFRAALFAFVANVALSVPLVHAIGFEGPALGTALAFVPTVMFYCWCIGRAAGLPFGAIFPVGSYLQILGVAAVAGAAGVAFKLGVAGPAGLKLAGTAAVVLAVFAAVGTLAGRIEVADWRYVGRWLRLDVLRRAR